MHRVQNVQIEPIATRCERDKKLYDEARALQTCNGKKRYREKRASKCVFERVKNKYLKPKNKIIT